MDSFSTLNSLASTAVSATLTGFAMHILDGFLPAPSDPSKTGVLSSAASIAIQAVANMYALGFLIDFRARMGYIQNVPAEVTIPVMSAILIASQPNFGKKLHNLYRSGISSWSNGFKMTLPGALPGNTSTTTGTPRSNIQVTERNQNVGSDAPMVNF